ncbi:hypothetical protein MXB_5138 [Myxobolus squamalis]|nr:hypothetical protein MXB_5138 [Myxobolus squamalis]
MDMKLGSLTYGAIINPIILKTFIRKCFLSLMLRSRNWSDINWAKISSDNKNLYGMNKALTVNMFDIEKYILIRDFYNETSQSFSRINSIALNRSDNYTKRLSYLLFRVSFIKWGNFNPLLGKYIGLYNTKDLSQLGYTIIFLNLAKIDFDNNLMFANISNNCEKFAVAVHYLSSI